MKWKYSELWSRVANAYLSGSYDGKSVYRFENDKDLSFQEVFLIKALRPYGTNDDFVTEEELNEACACFDWKNSFCVARFHQPKKIDRPWNEVIRDNRCHEVVNTEWNAEEDLIMWYEQEPYLTFLKEEQEKHIRMALLEKEKRLARLEKQRERRAKKKEAKK